VTFSPHISQVFRCGVKRRAWGSFPQAIIRHCFQEGDCYADWASEGA
jgi:hypothetical protein